MNFSYGCFVDTRDAIIKTKYQVIRCLIFAVYNAQMCGKTLQTESKLRPNVMAPNKINRIDMNASK